MNKLRPLSDGLVVRKIEEQEETSQGGIILTGQAKDQTSLRAEVLAVGPGRFENGSFVEMSVKVGECVVFGKYSGTEIDSQTLLIRESDVLAVEETA